MRDLGVSVADYEPLLINNRGQIAGAVSIVPGLMGKTGVVRALRGARPTGINDRGQVVGWARSAAADPVDWAFVWQDGRLQRLRTPSGYEAGAAYRQSTRTARSWGPFGSCARTQSKRGLDGQLVDPGAMYLDGTVSAALAINDRGQVVGSVTNQLEEGRAALWFDGVLTVLPGLRSGDSYYARSTSIEAASSSASLTRAGSANRKTPRAIIWKANRGRSSATCG